MEWRMIFCRFGIIKLESEANTFLVAFYLFFIHSQHQVSGFLLSSVVSVLFRVPGILAFSLIKGACEGLKVKHRR